MAHLAEREELESWRISQGRHVSHLFARRWNGVIRLKVFNDP